MSRPAGVAITARALRKRYGKVRALDDVDLDVRGGEFLTLLGPSGSGKTTLLMVLAGFIRPDQGHLRFGDDEVIRLAPHKRDIGMVFQNYALFPHMTVSENLAFPLSVRGMPKPDIKERVKRALAMVQLEGFRNRYPAQLSGGQQQRVALARALVFEPQLVLMDEPLGALDKQLREHMQIELKELHRQLGVTFVYVTHDQGEALTMSDRVAVFNDGAIQQIAPVEQMYEAPSNRFVAGFIGDSTVLRGTVRAADRERCGIVLPDGRVITGLNVNGARVGDAVDACIRPERIALHVQPPAERANVLQVRVAGVIYFGDHLRLLCSVGEGQADATVKVALGAMVPPRAGDTAWLELPPDLTRIYSLPSPTPEGVPS